MLHVRAVISQVLTIWFLKVLTSATVLNLSQIEVTGTNTHVYVNIFLGWLGSGLQV